MSEMGLGCVKTSSSPLDLRQVGELGCLRLGSDEARRGRLRFGSAGRSCCMWPGAPCPRGAPRGGQLKDAAWCVIGDEDNAGGAPQ